MLYSYSDCYLDDAKDILGTAIEYAVLHHGISGSEFLDLFLKSGIADEFGRGNCKYVAGMSGIELAYSIFSCCGIEYAYHNGELSYFYPPEYWCGWILAHYQWWSGLSFRDILARISYEDIRSLYILHEASEEKALWTIQRLIDRES